MINKFGMRNPMQYGATQRPSAIQFLQAADQPATGGAVDPLRLMQLRKSVIEQQMRPQRTAAQQMMAMPTRMKPTPAVKPPSLGDRISGMMPAAGTPQAAGLGAAGAKMLQLSGYSDKPIAMSQILGEAAQAYTTAKKETAAEQRKTAAEQAAAERQAIMDKMAMEKHTAELEKLRREGVEPKALSSAGKYASDLGFKIGTPEHTAAMEEYIAANAPAAPEIKFPKSVSDYAQKRMLKYGEQTDKAQALANNYDFIIKTLKANPNLETGKLTPLLLPSLQVLASAGLLDENQIKNVSSLESLNAAMKQVVPNMRPEGSGSTSNFEFANYMTATATLDKTPEGNLIIASTRKQAAERKMLEHSERERIFFESDGQKIPSGAELAEIMDEKYGSLFKSPFGREMENKSSDEVEAEFDNMIRAGKIRSGDVVYLGKHLSYKDEEGKTINPSSGFLIVDAEMIEAAKL